MLEMPFPEPVEALERQLGWLHSGRKRAALIPHYQPAWTASDRLGRLGLPAGYLYYDPARLRASELLELVEKLGLGVVLGYPTGEKPRSPTGCVTLRDVDGVEIWSHLVDEQTRWVALGTLKALAEESDTVREESPEEVAAGRCRYWLERVLAESKIG